MEKKIAKEERKLRALESNAEAYKKQTLTANLKTVKELEKNIQYKLDHLINDDMYGQEIGIFSSKCKT